MKNNEKFRAAVDQRNAYFGTLDTWLLFKLKNGKGFSYETEVTNISATGLFNPFELKYGVWNALMSIKNKIFPKPVDTLHNFGYVDAQYFGCPIQISTIVS